MLTFKQFDTQTIPTKKGFFKLGESIAHIEDLPPDEFLHCVKNLANLIATEKLDGANLVVGIDMDGRLYTSRESKGGERMYKQTASNRAADNGFRAAFAALEQVAPLVKKVLDSGDAVECEVLFGRQPNAIVYGSNYIAFLRMVPGDNGEEPDQSKVKQLNDELKGESVRVELSMVSTIDGSKLIVKDEAVTFKFTSAAVVDSFELHKVNVKKELADLEQWLKANPPASFKSKKAFADAAAKFMLPIKEKLLDDIIRKLKPALRDTEVTPDEDIGIEGIVVMDPKTGKQFKLVDKSVFTLINQFNHAIRNEIKSTFRFNRDAYSHLYTAFNASVGAEGHSLYDKMLAKIAHVVGIPGVGSYMQITRTIKSYSSPEAFVKAMHQDVGQVRLGVENAIKTGISDLDKAREKFAKNWQSYELQMKSGRNIKYTEEVFKRTLLVFAETRRELEDMHSAVVKAKTIAEIANGLFGKQLKAIR